MHAYIHTFTHTYMRAYKYSYINERIGGVESATF